MNGMTPRPTEPEILAFQAEVDAIYPPGAGEAPVSRRREWYDALCRAFDTPRPPGLAAVDGPIGPGGLKSRRYRPAGGGRGPVVLYLHGGGFVVGSLDSHDGVCAEIAGETGLDVVAVDYRLAPEHVWPAAFEDAAAAMRALLAEGRGVVLAGDSAGGSLAAGLAVLARDEGLDGVIGQALVYPMLGGDRSRGSYVEMAQAPGLTTADVAYYSELYAAPEDEGYAYPLHAGDLGGIAPAWVCAAHFDPLRDDGRDYAARLASYGVDVAFREDRQMVHGWLRARHRSPGAAAGFAALCRGIAEFAAGR